MTPAMLAWITYLLLVPLYVFKSGLPQPGDLFIMIMVPAVLWRWNGRLPRAAREALQPLLWFTGWVFVVNYSWAMILGKFGLFGPDTFVLYPLYYLYNALVFLAALVLFRRHGEAFLRVTLYVTYGIVGALVLSSFVTRGDGLRGSLFFNNPNQLGYYALLSACIIELLHRRLKQRRLTSGLALCACGYLSLISASRAAAIGISLLLIFMIFSNPRTLVVASIAAIALLAGGGPISNAIDASQQRVLAAQQNPVGFLEERGYDRLLAHKEYLLLGAGEGGFSRFNESSRVKNMEIHSSAGTVLFSYGVVGAILFLAFLGRVVWGAAARDALVLLPALIYTVAHQGLRFTMLWVLLAVFLMVKDHGAQRVRLRRRRWFASSGGARA
ncbi:MAG: hypothetical protein R2939_03600 [Kofleriaceae bacterium]